MEGILTLRAFEAKIYVTNGRVGVTKRTRVWRESARISTREKIDVYDAFMKSERRESTRRFIERVFLFAFALTFVFLSTVACGRTPPPKRQSSVAETPRPTPSGTPINSPPPVPPNAPKETGAGSTGDYEYTFERTGDAAKASFKPNLPLVQEVIEGAGRQVIFNVYGEKMEDFPRLVPWQYEDRTQAMMLTGNEHDYVFLHMTNDKREVPSLVFWRVPKDSVDY